MDALTIGLLLLAAVCHACWNLVLKRAAAREVVLWWSLILTVPLAVPVILGGGIPLRIWPLMAASVACQTGYYFSLARAYRHSDFSLVYPVARGAAPVLVLLWAALFLAERPKPAGLAGVAIILLGVVVVGGITRLRASGKSLQETGILAALQVAVFISGYTALDGAAVKGCNPLAYTACIYALTALAVTPLLARRPWHDLKLGWHRHAREILAIAVFSLAAYGLVLAAYSRGSVAYAAATREMNVVFGAFAGWQWLGEKMGAQRVLGACLIFAGILVVAVAG